MDLAVRLTLGALGLAAFAVLTLRDARVLSETARVGVPWVLVTIASTVLAGLVHLALTPEHWGESMVYGLVFLVAGATQLVIASLVAGAGLGRWPWYALVASNLVLVALYAVTRIVPPLGADLPESVDPVGAVTVLAEAGGSFAALVVTRHLPSPPRGQPTTSN